VNFELIARGPTEMTVRARCEALGVTEQGYYAFAAVAPRHLSMQKRMPHFQTRLPLRTNLGAIATERRA
jgi:hypothetical protein